MCVPSFAVKCDLGAKYGDVYEMESMSGSFFFYVKIRDLALSLSVLKGLRNWRTRFQGKWQDAEMD